MLRHPLAHVWRDERRPKPLQRRDRHPITGKPYRNPLLGAVVQISRQRDADVPGIGAAAKLLGAEVRLLERYSLFGWVDVTAHQHPLEHDSFFVRRQRVEQNPSPADRELPVAASILRCREFGAQREPGASRHDLERNAERATGNVPVQTELRIADRHPAVGIVSVADRAAFRQQRAGQRLRRAVGRDFGLDGARHQRIGTQPAVTHAQRQEVIKQHLARVDLQQPVALAAGGQRGAQQPRTRLALRTHGNGNTTLGADQPQADLLKFPFLAVATVVDRQAAVGDADLRQVVPVEAGLPHAAKPIEPGQQRNDVRRGTAFGHRLQREIRRHGRRLLRPDRCNAGERKIAAGKHVDAPIRVDPEHHVGIDQPQAFGARTGDQQTGAGETDFGFRCNRDQRTAGIAHDDVSKTNAGASVGIALELRAADLDAVLAAEIFLDRGGEPWRGEVEDDRTTRKTPPQGAPCQSDNDDGGDEGDCEPANQRTPPVDRQPGPRQRTNPLPGSGIFPESRTPPEPGTRRRRRRRRGLARLRSPVPVQSRFQFLKRAVVRTVILVRHARSGVPSSAGPHCRSYRHRFAWCHRDFA
jgi:hypothetical protein